MGFKEVQSLDADVTIALGGTNKKTGKANPTKAEGYYLGSRIVEDRKKKSGKSYIYILQTPKGNLGVWGKTDLDRKMVSVTPGEMIRMSVNGTRSTPNGDMYVFKVEHDPENTIEVLPQGASALNSGAGFDDSAASEGFGDEAGEDEETAYVPPQVSQASAADRKAKIDALLKNKR